MCQNVPLGDPQASDHHQTSHSRANTFPEMQCTRPPPVWACYLGDTPTVVFTDPTLALTLLYLEHWLKVLWDSHTFQCS